MTYDNEAIVRHAYHTAEGNVLDIPGWVGSFTKDGVFNNVSSLSGGKVRAPAHCPATAVSVKIYRLPDTTRNM